MQSVASSINEPTGSLWLASCAVILLAAPVQATVLEYDEEGTVTVTETKREASQALLSDPTRTGPSVTALRSLTRDVAIRYSGAVGVRKAGLDAFTFVEVFDALVERESAFNPTALSEKGAQGLGQLMPGTAADMGVTNAFDPNENLNGSAKYLTILLAEFGSLELALAAYNAGPERVRQYDGVPPFAETRAYIDWIFAKAGVTGATPEPVNATTSANPSSQPINKEQPLQGDVSVWEF